jgi:hypothetical protein
LNRGRYELVQLDHCGFVPAGLYHRDEVALAERYSLDWVLDDFESNPFLWVEQEDFGPAASSYRRPGFVPGEWSQRIACRVVQIACLAAWFRSALLLRGERGVFWQRVAKLIPSLPARISAESNQ